MSQRLMMHIRESLSSRELQVLASRMQQQRGWSVHAGASSKPHLHFLSSDVSPHKVLKAVREQGYHACLVDL